MKKILSISGGGVRGIIPAVIVKYIEEQTGKQAYQLFDYIAGTSAGGINALALSLPIKGEDLVSFYLQKSSEIFSRSFWHKITSLNNLAGSKYDGAGLSNTLNSVFGNTNLSQAKVKLLIPSYEIEKRQTLFFKSWHKYDFKMADVGIATSSAPTYFPPYTISSLDKSLTYYCVDGGLFCNQPSLSALAEVMLVDSVQPKDCLVLSLNTGNDETPINYNSAKGWGELSWINPVIDIALDSSQDLVNYQMKQLMPVDQYLNLNTAKGAITGSIADLDNTDASNLNNLVGIANNIINDNKSQIDAFINKLIC